MRKRKSRFGRLRRLKKTVRRAKRLLWLGPLYKNRKKVKTALCSLNDLASLLLKNKRAK